MRIELATPADDHDLRAIMRDSPMPGAVQIAPAYPGGFFEALHVYGRHNEVVVARDSATGRVVGLACRSVKTALINGRPAPLGYLSSLRLLPEYRHGTILARIFRGLRDRHQDGRTRLYLTSIIADNTTARRLLTSGRCGLPTYHDCGRVCTLGLRPRAVRRSRSSRDFEIRAARPVDVPAVADFLNRQGPRRQFFPCYQAEDFQSSDGLLPGVAINDVVLCLRRGEVLGTAAAWDQRAFRQICVTGYSSIVRMGRHVYNWMARLAGYPNLPAPGSQPDYFYLSLVCIRDDDPTVFAALLDDVLARLQSRAALLVVGLHERDPLLPVVRRYRCLAHAACLYVACWEDGETQFRELDERVPYVEMGAL